MTSHDENMQYLNLALRAVQPGRGDSTRGLGDKRPAEPDPTGQTRKRAHSARGPDPFAVPFGPNLAPVRRQGLDVGSAAAPERGPSRTQPRKIQPSPPLTQSGLCARAGGASDDREAAGRAVTTNDLLGCLAHPDIIARVTELLLERHAGKSRNAPFC